MTTIDVMTAGERLEVGDIMYIKHNKAYKIRDARQLPRGVISKRYEKGEVIDGLFTGGTVASKDGVIGCAGEDLIGGRYISLHSDGKWYNAKEV